MILDMEEGSLGFMIGGRHMGPAHTGLRGKRLHVIVSAVWGHCEITMRYRNGLEPGPLSLLSLARLGIRGAIFSAAAGCDDDGRKTKKADDAGRDEEEEEDAAAAKEAKKKELGRKVERLVLPRSMKQYLLYEDTMKE